MNTAVLLAWDAWSSARRCAQVGCSISEWNEEALYLQLLSAVQSSALGGLAWYMLSLKRCVPQTAWSSTLLRFASKLTFRDLTGLCGERDLWKTQMRETDSAVLLREKET